MYVQRGRSFLQQNKRWTRVLEQGLIQRYASVYVHDAIEQKKRGHLLPSSGKYSSIGHISNVSSVPIGYGAVFSRNYSSTSSASSAPSDGTEVAKVVVDNTPATVDAVAAAAGAVAPPDPNFVIGAMMNCIDQVHLMADVPYFAAIIATTVALRICLLPVAIKTILGSSRMAVMRPEMMKLQTLMQQADMNDPKVQHLYQQQMRALFDKHKVNPFYAFFWPLSQFPVFIASFLALKDMGLYYPGLATGGAFWFHDLTAADPYLILPLFNSLSFLAMIELGGDGVQMEQQQQKTFKMVMRGLAVAMVPLTMNMPQAVFIYWSTNNVLSLIQSAVIKQPAVKKMLNIPEPPKAEDTPALKINSPFKSLSEALARQRAQDDSAKAKIIEGKVVPGPPVTPHPSSVMESASNEVKTSTLPPRKRNRTK